MRVSSHMRWDFRVWEVEAHTVYGVNTRPQGCSCPPFNCTYPWGCPILSHGRLSGCAGASPVQITHTCSGGERMLWLCCTKCEWMYSCVDVFTLVSLSIHSTILLVVSSTRGRVSLFLSTTLLSTMYTNNSVCIKPSKEDPMSHLAAEENIFQFFSQLSIIV